MKEPIGEILGSATPRIFTPPLPGRGVGAGPSHGCPCGCALSRETSRGFEVIEWSADTLGILLNPWQHFLLIHALELDAGLTGYRFRTVLVLVARQNGKTLVKAILTLWRMFEDGAKYLVGTAQDLSQAREVMNEVLVPMMTDNPNLRERFDPDNPDTDLRRGIWHKTLNDEYFRLDSRWRGGRAIGPMGPRYLIKALNRRAGRGLSAVEEVNIDELREQTDHKGWAAISKVVMAADNAQIWCMSNMGDTTSVVLNHLRGVAMGGTDPTLFHAEWSGVEGCELDDREQWAQANPSLGFTLKAQAIESALLTDPPSVFRTEVLCQGVDVLNTAIDPGGWAACADPAGLGGDGAVALCLETALDGGQTVAVKATKLSDGRVRIELAAVWDSPDAAKLGLDSLKAALRPKAIGWYPKGPGASLSAKLRGYNPKATDAGSKARKVAHEITGLKVAEAHMTFAERVEARALIHPDSAILNEHARYTGMVGTDASWIFDRGPGATQAMWAAAGALYLALYLPEPKPRKRRVITLDPSDIA